MTYSVILDIVIALVAVIAIARGASKGFVTAVFDMFTFVAAIVLAAIFKNPVAKYIMNTPIFQNTKNNIENELYNSIKNAGESLSSQEMLTAFENNNKALVGIIENFGGDMSALREHILGNAADTGENLSKSLSQYIIEPLANACSHIIAFIVIFLVSLLALWLLKKILNVVFELPLLKQVNKIGGVLLGFISAFLYASLIVAVFAPLLENTHLFGFALPEGLVENSYIFLYLRDNNIFYYIISLFTGNGNVI